MKITLSPVPLLFCLLAVASCGQQRDSDQSQSGRESAQTAELTDAADVAGGRIEGSTSNGTDAPPARPTSPVIGTSATRLLVYRAQLRLRVEDLPAAKASIEEQARRNGYVSAANETRQDGEWRQEMTLRIRPQNFERVLKSISKLGTVEQNQLSTDDVTAEHADVAARLRTKRAVEQRYVGLLSRASKIAEILSIEEKIGEVREDIERTEARLKTLDDQVAYSTIEVTCYEPLTMSTPEAPVVSLGSRLLSALYGGWELLAALAVGAVSIWPLLLLGAAGWWAVRRWRARRPAGK